MQKSTKKREIARSPVNPRSHARTKKNLCKNGASASNNNGLVLCTSLITFSWPGSYIVNLFELTSQNNEFLICLCLFFKNFNPFISPVIFISSLFATITKTFPFPIYGVYMVHYKFISTFMWWLVLPFFLSITCT